MDSNRKVAVLFCGHIRTWNQCRPGFIKFMRDTDYDVFVHTYTQIKSYHPYIRDTHKMQDNDVSQSVDDIRNEFGLECKHMVVEDETDAIPEIKEVENKDLKCYQWPQYGPYDDLQVLKGKGISIRTYLQYRKFRLCNELRKKYERDNSIAYDYVIRLRMDLDYSRVPVSLNETLRLVTRGKIFTSSANSQPNDHIYIGLPNDIDALVTSLGSVKVAIDREYSPHEYLHLSLQQAGLSYQPSIHNLEVIRV